MTIMIKILTWLKTSELKSEGGGGVYVYPTIFLLTNPSIYTKS